VILRRQLRGGHLFQCHQFGHVPSAAFVPFFWACFASLHEFAFACSAAGELPTALFSAKDKWRVSLRQNTPAASHFQAQNAPVDFDE
jgi:hypothetical protein